MKRVWSILSIFLLIVLTSKTSWSGNKNLKPSIASQKRQNRIADRYKLARLKNLTQLKKSIKKGYLVKIDDSDAYFVSEYTGVLDPDNQELYWYARPWVLLFLDSVLREGFDTFKEDFKVTSLVRTRWYQRKLSEVNSHAIIGRAKWQQSSHLTGSTVDVSYKGMSRKLQRWFEKKLSRLEKRGLIEATKEFGSYHYHIMVHPLYGKLLKRLKSKKRKARRSKTRR